jgi:hypothetical protein
MSRADRTLWEEYVRDEAQRFYAHCEGVTFIWANGPAADKLVAKLGDGTRTMVRFTDEFGRERTQWEYAGGDSELAAFSGPWHVVRKHVTTEFRQWVEEYDGTKRLTLSQWRAEQIAERSEIAFTESAEYTLGQLEELRRLIAERDALILEASKRGASKVAIASAVGLSRQQIHTVIASAELAPVTPIRAEYDAPTEYVTTASGETVEVF